MIGVRLVKFELDSKFDDTREQVGFKEWWQKRFIIQLSFPWGRKHFVKPLPDRVGRDGKPSYGWGWK